MVGEGHEIQSAAIRHRIDYAHGRPKFHMASGVLRMHVHIAIGAMLNAGQGFIGHITGKGQP